MIGGGFIGLEIAAVARSLGKTVKVIEVRQRLMARAVASVLSDFFLDMHRSQGVNVLLSTTIAEVQSNAVLLQNGGSHTADLVLAGIGVMPNTELARNAGLTVANGIVVNEFLRTEDPDIYAIGDCADHPNQFAGGPLPFGIGAECGRSGQVRGAYDYRKRHAVPRCALVLDRPVRPALPDGGDFAGTRSPRRSGQRRK